MAHNSTTTGSASCGLKEWAEKNKAGGAVQQAKKAQRVAARQDVRAGLAATRAELAARNAELDEKYHGIRAAHADERAEQLAARGETFEGVTLAAGQISYKDQGGPVAGATARVESAADVRQRVTASRVLAMGVLALAAKKQAGHVFLTVEGPGFEFVVEVPVKREAQAREFAARVNTAARA